MAKKGSSDERMKQLRMLIIGFFALIIVIVVGYGALYSTGATEGEYAEGEHYERLDVEVRRRPGAPVEVVEFFSYGCVHCKNFDPLIEDWKEDLDDSVAFRRQPVAFSPIWTLLGRTYITLEEMDILEQNHERIFRAVHDQGRQFLTAEMMAEFVDGNGTDAATFLREFNSPTVRRKAAGMEQAARDLRVNSVPTLIVGGEYQVNMNAGRKLALDIVDHLVAKIRAETPSS